MPLALLATKVLKGAVKVVKKGAKVVKQSKLYEKSLVPITTPYSPNNTGIVGNVLLDKDKKSASDTIADKINDFLGKATKDSRTIETDNSVSNQTIFLIGGVIIAAIFFYKKK